jgi:hypothetical protein
VAFFSSVELLLLPLPLAGASFISYMHNTERDQSNFRQDKDVEKEKNRREMQSKYR